MFITGPGDQPGVRRGKVEAWDDPQASGLSNMNEDPIH